MSNNNSSGNPAPQQQTITWVNIPHSGGFTISVGQGGFIGGGFVPAPTEAKKKNKDGCDCKKCKEFYPYAEPNQDDGTLICYKCRHGW